MKKLICLVIVLAIAILMALTVPEKKEHKTTAPAEAPKSAPQEPEFESEKHRALYLAIQGLDHPASVEELIAITGFEAADIAELLLDLELSDTIVNKYNRYSVT